MTSSVIACETIMQGAELIEAGLDWDNEQYESVSPFFTQTSAAKFWAVGK